MARRTPDPVQQFRGTTAKHATYIGPAGEITVDTDKNTAVVHDGTTAGGHPLAKESTTITASNGLTVTAGGTLAAATNIAGVDASTSAKGVVLLEDTLTGTANLVPDSAAVKTYVDNAVETYTATAPLSIDANNEISISAATTTDAGSMSAADKTKLDGITTMIGATASAAGASGLVPAPAAGDDAKFLKGDGTWAAAGETYTAAAPLSIDSNNEISVADATASSKGVVQVGTNVDVASGVISVKPWADHVTNHTSAVLADYQEGAIIETDEPIYGDDAVIAPVEQTLTNAAGKVPSSAAVTAALNALVDGIMPDLSRAIDISAYNSPSNYYTTPCAGYVYIFGGPNSNAGNYIYARTTEAFGSFYLAAISSMTQNYSMACSSAVATGTQVFMQKGGGWDNPSMKFVPCKAASLS